MNSEQIQEYVYQWALTKNFTAPYGVLTGSVSVRPVKPGQVARGKKFRSVTFGYARTLDATVEIYNRNFILLRTSRGQPQVFKDLPSLMKELENL